MFLAKNEIKLYALMRDPIGRLLFLNALFVIIGYAIGNWTGGVLTGNVSILKNVFLFGSFVYLLSSNSIINPMGIFDSGFTPIVFGILILYVSIGTGTDSKGYFRVLTFFVPLVYVYLSLSYLVSKFGVSLLLSGLHWGLLLIYCVPLLIYIVSGGKIAATNIYGPGGDEQAFGSNNYGWSAAIYILAYLFVWKDVHLKKYWRIFFGFLFLIAIILFFTSANRASWLSMAVAMIPFFFKYKELNIKYKIAGILVVLGFVAYLLADPNSSLNYASNKTEKQEQVGESRFETAQVMFDQFNADKTRWITGIGMFNFNLLKNRDVLKGYHNSYYEVLFGAGIPLFLVFLSFMVLRPVVKFAKYYSKYTLLLPPLMIIPFFESNLTGGQFLFFPWFTFMLLLNAKKKYWNKATFDASRKRREIMNDADLVESNTGNPVL
ncbi:MAG TPA: O-antigen ligase family protein [Hanamia sp.]|nr:O-antigen ligase family protein [Hanamia sp.]